MKRIYTAANLQDAHILAHILREAGIGCHIFNENLQGGVGEIPFTHAYPEIWLAEAGDTERAREIIREFERPVPARAPRSCPHCGEENPGHFLSCWQCGHDLGGAGDE